ncbi:hypothetical protein M0813_02444 [Anaeramoeba flamelloides]|uniref:PAS domain-containing protein n=1 Tax=Anaeramoeba flamelloides TaxID=1746091 RepID=A0ABQ8YDD0_9EUKA|nr:hypothetical protein M0813_02444 [Anaeramoeba flamelloides]
MGNAEHSHKIKKRHKKKYFKKLESSGLPILVLDANYKAEFVSTNTFKLYGLDPKKLTGKEDLMKYHKPYQTKFKCDSKTAISIIHKSVLESKDGTYVTEWEGVTCKGEDLNTWLRVISTQIGKKKYIQVIFQRKNTTSENGENNKPDSLDDSILRVQIEDNSGSVNNSEFSMNYKPQLSNSNSTEFQVKKNRTIENSPQTETNIAKLTEIDEIIDIVDEIKNKIRSFKEPEHEKVMVQKLNILIKTVEKQKTELYEQTMRLVQKSKEQNLKNRNKYKDLENQFQTRSNLLSKERDKIEKLEIENQMLKEQSQKYQNFILLLNKSSRKIIKQNKIFNETKKIENTKQN